MGFCDPCIRSLPAGTVIQLERKGFFRIDKPYQSEDKPAVLFAIPDGRIVKNQEKDTPATNKKSKK